MDVSGLLESLMGTNSSASGGNDGNGTQTIQFNASEGLTSWGLSPKTNPTGSSEVELIPSPDIGSTSSHFLKLKSLVNSSWSNRPEPGRSVAVHRKGLYYAHVTAIVDSKESSQGAVRVVNRESGERILIKGIVGKVMDIAFAHLSLVVIGCIDEFGDLHVYSISESAKGDRKLSFDALIQLKYGRSKPSKYNLISWCPYMQERGKPEEGLESSFLAISHDSTSEIINVKAIIREHGSGTHSATELTSGRLQLEDRQHPITAIQISPDGTALATASLDGVVQFFQIYFASCEPPRCLHSWTPHANKKQVSSLFFLDDLTGENRSVDYWSYAITGFNDNKELRLWCCNDWNCIQVIHFKSPKSVLKASLDQTSRYLILSDIVQMNLYVFKIELLNSQMRIVSVSEFATLNPFFSISIVDAGIKKLGDLHIKDTTLSDDDDDDFDVEDTPEEVDNSREATVILFYLAYPRGLQECRIVYNDASSLDLKEKSRAIDSSSLERKLISQPPDMHSSPSKLETAAQQISSLISPEMMNGGLPKKQPPISGGSSPSREVQDILGDSNHDLGEDIVVTEENYDDEDEDVIIESASLDQFPSAIAPPKADCLLNNFGNKSFESTPGASDVSSTQKGSISLPLMLNGSHGNDLNANPANELLLKKMDDLMKLIRKDGEEIKKLRDDIKELKKVKPAATDPSKMLNQRFRDQEKLISNKIHSSIKGEMQTASSHSLALYKKDSREALSKVVHSKQFMDSLATTLTDCLHPMIQSTFKETFIELIIPAFERSCGNMMSQMASTFNKGAKEYESTVRNHLKEVIGQEQALLIKEMRDSVSSLNSSAERNVAQKVEENEKLLNELRKVIQEAISSSSNLDDSTSKSDVVLHRIQMLLNASKYNEAFKVALSSNSLPIAVATCQMVDPGIIFGEDKCPLEQSVILALIQHCATDLEEHTALKLSYLEEAIMNVDPNYPPLEANANIFVAKVVKSMQSYINDHPNTKFSKSLKLRLMAVKSFIKD